MSEWMEMDTAPSDGTDVLIGWWCVSGRDGGIYWNCAVGYWSEGRGSWQYGSHHVRVRPKKWQPLPEPPKP